MEFWVDMIIYGAVFACVMELVQIWTEASRSDMDD